MDLRVIGCNFYGSVPMLNLEKMKSRLKSDLLRKEYGIIVLQKM